MNDAARQALDDQLSRDEKAREELRLKLERVFNEYEQRRVEFAQIQGRIDDIREELGRPQEERVTVTPPDLIPVGTN